MGNPDQAVFGEVWRIRMKRYALLRRNWKNSPKRKSEMGSKLTPTTLTGQSVLPGSKTGMGSGQTTTRRTPERSGEEAAAGGQSLRRCGVSGGVGGYDAQAAHRDGVQAVEPDTPARRAASFFTVRVAPHVCDPAQRRGRGGSFRDADAPARRRRRYSSATARRSST